jgi:hypothetical protein
MGGGGKLMHLAKLSSRFLPKIGNFYYKKLAIKIGEVDIDLINCVKGSKRELGGKISILFIIP